MPSLPTVGGDNNTWGTELNEFLSVGHNADGTIGTWAGYTPTWTSSGTAPAVGNGTIAGRYFRQNDFVRARIYLLLGSTSTVGTGTYSWSLPVAGSFTGIYAPLGAASFLDSSAGQLYTGVVVVASSTTIAAYTAASPGSQFSATVPVAPANTDIFQFELSYEAA